MWEKEREIWWWQGGGFPQCWSQSDPGSVLSLYNLITFGCLPALRSLSKAHQAPRCHRYAHRHRHATHACTAHEHKSAVNKQDISFLFQLKEHDFISWQAACPEPLSKVIQGTEGNCTKYQEAAHHSNVFRQNISCKVKITGGWNRWEQFFNLGHTDPKWMFWWAVFDCTYILCIGSTSYVFLAWGKQ